MINFLSIICYLFLFYSLGFCTNEPLFFPLYHSESVKSQGIYFLDFVERKAIKMKRLLLILSIAMILSSCSQEQKAKDKDIEIIGENNSTEIYGEIEESNNNQNEIESQKVGSEIYTYPITGLTLTDFCQFSFEEKTTLLTDVINSIGEPPGYYNESEPYFKFYDGTTIAFKIDPDGYIYEPYVTDITGRIFTNINSQTRLDLFDKKTIELIKNGEYMPFFYEDQEFQAMINPEITLSFSDFGQIVISEYRGTNSGLLDDILGEAYGVLGSGLQHIYYRLLDGSFIFYRAATYNEDWHIYQVELVDNLGRSFIYDD